MIAPPRIAAALAVTLAASQAAAAPVLWTLEPLLFPGGGTVSGSFLFDDDLQTISGVSLTATGTAQDGVFDTIANPYVPAAPYIQAVVGALGDDLGDPVVYATFAEPLPAGGGSVAVTNALVGTCTVDGCAGMLFLPADFLGATDGAGNIVGTDPVGRVSAPVPLPLPGALLLAGLGALGLAARGAGPGAAARA